MVEEMTSPVPEFEERTRLSKTAVNLGLFFNILLAVFKTGIGILGHSTALLADGINSTSDVAYTLIISLFVRAAGKPADTEHPYGHTQYESVGALVVGAFVITTAITIFWNSLNTLFDILNKLSDPEPSSLITLWIALATVLIKIFLTLFTRQIGKKTLNPSVQAIAADHRNDIFSASAVLIGIFLNQQGYIWVDPLAGALVALVILSTGIGILRDSTSDLMDTVPGKTLRAEAEKLLSTIPGVKGIDSMRAHRYGQYLGINITIIVNGDLTVDQGDQIATQVEETLRQGINYVRDVHVHFHSSRS